MSKISEFLINNGWAVAVSVVIVIGGISVSHYRIDVLAGDMQSNQEQLEDIKTEIHDLGIKQAETSTKLEALDENLKRYRIEDREFQQEMRARFNR